MTSQSPFYTLDLDVRYCNEDKTVFRVITTPYPANNTPRIYLPSNQFVKQTGKMERVLSIEYYDGLYSVKSTLLSHELRRDKINNEFKPYIAEYKEKSWTFETIPEINRFLNRVMSVGINWGRLQ